MLRMKTKKCEQPQHLAILSALNLSSERGLSEKLLPHVATNEDNDFDDGRDAWTRYVHPPALPRISFILAYFTSG